MIYSLHVGALTVNYLIFDFKLTRLLIKYQIRSEKYLLKKLRSERVLDAIVEDCDIWYIVLRRRNLNLILDKKYFNNLNFITKLSTIKNCCQQLLLKQSKLFKHVNDTYIKGSRSVNRRRSKYPQFTSWAIGFEPQVTWFSVRKLAVRNASTAWQIISVEQIVI